MMGVFATHFGLLRDLCRAANLAVERLRGGLAASRPAGMFFAVVIGGLQVGQITPPTGMNLPVLKRVVPQGIVPGLGSGTVKRGGLPFLAADLVRLARLAAFPALSLGLPGLRQ